MEYDGIPENLPGMPKKASHELHPSPSYMNSTFPCPKKYYDL